MSNVDFGPAEVVVNDVRYVREETLFAAMQRVDDLEGALAAFPLVPDVRGYSGPRPVWAEWYDEHVLPILERAEAANSQERP